MNGPGSQSMLVSGSQDGLKYCLFDKNITVRHFKHMNHCYKGVTQCVSAFNVWIVTNYFWLIQHFHDVQFMNIFYLSLQFLIIKIFFESSKSCNANVLLNFHYVIPYENTVAIFEVWPHKTQVEGERLV